MKYILILLLTFSFSIVNASKIVFDPAIDITELNVKGSFIDSIFDSSGFMEDTAGFLYQLASGFGAAHGLFNVRLFDKDNILIATARTAADVNPGKQAELNPVGPGLSADNGSVATKINWDVGETQFATGRIEFEIAGATVDPSVFVRRILTKSAPFKQHTQVLRGRGVHVLEYKFKVLP